MIDFYELLTGLTMVMVGFVFLALSIINYAIIPNAYSITEIVGSIVMIIAAFYVLFKTILG